jgi:2-(1,2-epoxy-1,2-dihydrophenyl)acetyl-CoA isomerase
VRPMNEIGVELRDDHVAVVEIRRGPENFFDTPLIGALADTYEQLDNDPACRAVVLCSEGRHFCAGADFRAGAGPANVDPAQPDRHLYDEALRLFRTRTPVVAAVQGAAVGGGLGLALSADFRVAAPESRFAANFARLGFHHGFGLTVTLPAAVGQQRALELLLTGRRIGGDVAAAIGLVDHLTSAERIRERAIELASEIAASAPLAVVGIRETMRGDLAERVRVATRRERAQQDQTRESADRAEGILAAKERRNPRFVGR